jgi:hypothetical protein
MRGETKDARQTHDLSLSRDKRELRRDELASEVRYRMHEAACPQVLISSRAHTLGQRCLDTQDWIGAATRTWCRNPLPVPPNSNHSRADLQQERAGSVMGKIQCFPWFDAGNWH